jgi:hypothetical protein
MPVLSSIVGRPIFCCAKELDERLTMITASVGINCLKLGNRMVILSVNVSEDNSKAVLIKQKMQTKKNPGTSPEFLVMI